MYFKHYNEYILYYFIIAINVIHYTHMHPNTYNCSHNLTLNFILWYKKIYRYVRRCHLVFATLLKIFLNFFSYFEKRNIFLEISILKLLFIYQFKNSFSLCLHSEIFVNYFNYKINVPSSDVCLHLSLEATPTKTRL